ncbi:MAG: altronate dehydratase family protein [Pseudomonadota bacterium]
MPEASVLRLHGDDNIVVALSRLGEGTALENGIATAERIMAGHKVATQPIAAGEPVRKFGQIIGYASTAVDPGQHVHTHNCDMGEHDRDYQFGIEAGIVLPAEKPLTFQGYRRSDGRVGTRNYVAICSSVNCSATVCRYAADEINHSGILEDYQNVDGIVAFSHGTGCGIAGDGEGFDNLERVIWGHATHANVGAALFIGLGCETFQLARMAEKYDISDPRRFHRMTIQGTGGTRKTIEQAVAKIRELLPLVNDISRTECPASGLKVALQCGGSDGLSGVTANPALGHAVDLLVAQGGTGILAETPEIYGAEHLLVRRAASEKVGRKLIERIEWWEDYTARNRGEMNNNPSPGNKAGGLTTILEKSLGAAAKGGTTPLTGVYHYGERVDTPGFVFMDSPGYDPASVTGQIAAGANLVCFTTGRGSAFGSKPAPTVKLATNSRTYENMTEDMDINCGDIAEGKSTVEEKGREILTRFLAVASGERSKSEALGLGDNEFVPWQIGATM